MCGIVGLVRRDADPALDRRIVARMLARIVHRGPDDEGMEQSGTATLGLRRLSIIDLAGGHQPIANEDRTVWIVCNGEIYNFRRLRRDLESAGHRFSTRSDAEVALHAYEEWGLDFLERIEGMFGLAVYDSRRRRLVLARDRLGIKPVYYAERDGDLAFASEIKSLLCVPGLSAAIDSDGLLDHLTLGYAVAPNTIFDGVRKLAPAEYLLWDDGRVERRRYWKLPTTVDGRRTEREWIEAVRAELDRAVDDHLIADVPVGAFLSGGVDSSALVGLMSRKSAEPVNTYSIGYTGSSAASYYNELPFARRVAARYGTRHREIPVAPNVAELLPKLMWHLEEPVSDTAVLTTYLVSQLASETVKVIVSGVGGDELFAGYNRYLGEHYGAAYRRLPRWLRNRVIEPAAALLPSGRSNRLLDLARYARQFLASDRLDWKAQYKNYVRLGRPDVVGALLDVAGRSDGFDSAAAMASAEDPLLRLLSVDAETQLPEMLLLLSDKMTMAASIECRVPLLDQRLVELTATMPADVKLKGGRLKHVFKQAVADVLPPEVLARRKRGFGAPLGAWFSGELARLRADVLGNQGLARRGLVDPDVLGRICADHDARREDYTDLIMVLVNLEIWCRLFLDGASAADVGRSLTAHRRAA